MTATQVMQIKQALEAMFNHVSARESIAQAIVEIERLRLEVQATAPAQLTHYLERRSYTKALDYLQTGIVIEDPDQPDCDSKPLSPTESEVRSKVTNR